MTARGTRASGRIGPRLAAVAALACAGPLPSCVDLSGLRDALTNACGSAGCATQPQDCASLSSASWAVEGNLTATETVLAVGASVEVSLTPAVETQCEGFVASVTWHVDNPGVATVVSREQRPAWITGVSPGLTSLGARLVFSDGVAREARARTVRVVPPTASTGGELVVRGSVTIAPFVAGSGNVWNGWVTFTTRAAGRIDVTIDWGSPLNRVDMSGYEGHCNAIGSCGRIRMTSGQWGVKPLSAPFHDPRMPAGGYTIRIDNLGPGEETVRYEVRLTPS